MYGLQSGHLDVSVLDGYLWRPLHLVKVKLRESSTTAQLDGQMNETGILVESQIGEVCKRPNSGGPGNLAVFDRKLLQRQANRQLVWDLAKGIATQEQCGQVGEKLEG